MKGTIGIIGLGIMGGAFARNLAAGGWKVIGYDIDAARKAEAKAAGVKIAASAEAVAKAAKRHHHQPADAACRARHRPR